MDISKPPFFFSDKFFLQDVTKWKQLLDKSFDVTKQLNFSDSETLIKDEIEKTAVYCNAVLDAHILFMKIGIYITNQITNNPDLMEEYNLLYPIPYYDVVNAQIFQFILPELTLNELINIVNKNKETANKVNEFVKKNFQNS
jgi:hypothetical protein